MFYPYGMSGSYSMNAKEMVIIGIMIIGIVGGIIAAMILTRPTYGPRSTPLFNAGEMVEMSAFGTQGMVVSQSCPRAYKEISYQCTYAVRFSAIQMNTDISLFGADGPVDVAPIALVRGVREFELRHVR